MKNPIKQKNSKKHQHLSLPVRGISMDMTKYQSIQKFLTPKYYSKEGISISNPIIQPKTKFNSFSPNKTNKETSNSLLPPLKASELQSTKTLVLDLDETLIHSSFNQFSIESDINIKVDLENQTKNVYVLIRPYLNDFFKRVSMCYEIVIFTASLSKYANRLIDIIDKERVCKYRLFREQCTLINNIYVKELKRLNRNMKNVVIVDNNPNSYSLDKENGIPIESFIDDTNDNELIQMAYILEKIAKGSDVRVLIKEIVNMNHIDYDKAFELFKNKENDNKLIEECNKDLFDKHSNEEDNEVNMISSIKGKIQIINVEKRETKQINNRYSSLSIPKTIKPNVKQINDLVDNANIINNNNQSSFLSASVTSFNSAENKSIQYNNDLTGKLFRSFGNTCKSKSKDGFCTVKTNNNPFLKYKNNNRNKSEKVKLLPKARFEDRKTEEDYNKLIIMKTKSKNSMNGQCNSTINANEISKDLNSLNIETEIPINKSNKRPASVIPLKPNSLKKKSEEIASSPYYKSKNILSIKQKQKHQHQQQQHSNGSIPTTIEQNSNKLFLIKGNQSSRASLHNLPTTISNPCSHRVNNIEDTQSSISSKLSSKENKKKSNKKYINSQPKKSQLENDSKILKIISNKTILSFNRSKTSSEKQKHFNIYKTNSNNIKSKKSN